MTTGRRQFLARSASLASGLFVTTEAMAQGNEAPRDRIKIGQIGVAHGHANKLAVFRNSDDYEVIGVVEPDLALQQRAEKTPAFAGVQWLSREELFATPGLQAVLIETSVRDLLPHAHAAIEAGKHIHLDKPAGESLPELQAILEIAQRKKRLLQMGYMYRYNPGVVLLREFLRQGWLGEVFEVDAVMSKVIEPNERQELAVYPGGSMFELGCHLIDLVIAILGEPQKVVPFPRHSSPMEDSLVDNMLAVLEYPKATATVRSSVLEVLGFERRHLTVCGTEGTFHIQPLDNPTVKLSLPRPRGKYLAGTHVISLPKYTRYVDDARDMARIIRGEKTSDFSADHDLIVQRTLLQACGLL